MWTVTSLITILSVHKHHNTSPTTTTTAVPSLYIPIPHSIIRGTISMSTSTSREGPNPLRPYYRPPSIGIPQDIHAPGTTTGTGTTTSSGTHGLALKNGSAASYASSARDMFDYSDYLSDSSPSSVEAVKRILDDWVYKYFSILLAQPFDVSKTVLQVRSQDAAEGPSPAAKEVRSSGYRDSMYSEASSLLYT